MLLNLSTLLVKLAMKVPIVLLAMASLAFTAWRGRDASEMIELPNKPVTRFFLGP
ncbi:hypothetical protein OK016_09150 [Vibrio chagasii]|nr:hypothetical protein [Vibrio chagasii]